MPAIRAKYEKNLNAFLFVTALLFQTITYADFGDGLVAFSKEDFQAAFKELKPLAEQGNASAQTFLGDMFGSGLGVAQDYVEAHKWLNIVGADGNADAIKYRSIVEKLMIPEQIAKAQDLAREWMSKHGQ